MLEFMDARIWNGDIWIIDDARPLVVGNIKSLRFKFQASPWKLAELVVKELVDRPAIIDFRPRKISNAVCSAAFKRYVRMVEKSFKKRVVSREGNALIVIVEIIHVIVFAHGNAANDARVDAFWIAPPLFRSVAAEESVKNGF